MKHLERTLRMGIRIRELEEKVAYLEEEVRWRQELLKSRTETIYQMIQRAQDCLQDLPEDMVK